MDSFYADTVRLLLSVAPDIFANKVFAMKGGTAINLFVRDMPRLSIDIDIVYLPLQAPRDQALTAIDRELAAIEERLAQRGLHVKTIASHGLSDSKLLIDNGESQVKVEVNVVFRGTVLPIERRPLSARPAATFTAELELPVLAVDELYGSKLVAAMDRQHPRDIFDVSQMYEHHGLTDGVVECFVTYLAGHNRPTHEVLPGRPKDITEEYRNTFVGMTTEPVELKTLLAARERLFHELPARLTERQRRFLISLTRAEPDWRLLLCPHAAELPALQWKLKNLQVFKERRRPEFESQLAELEKRLGG